MVALAIILGVVGAVLELIGLALVAQGISEDRREARKLLAAPPPRPSRPERTYPAPLPVPPRRYGPSSQRDLSASERVRNEDAIARIATRLTNAVIEVRKQADEQVDKAIDELRADVE